MRFRLSAEDIESSAWIRDLEGAQMGSTPNRPGPGGGWSDGQRGWSDGSLDVDRTWRKLKNFLIDLENFSCCPTYFQA